MKKFKTAEELGLSEKHYCALVKTIDALANNKIRHISISKIDQYSDAAVGKEPGRFNMNHWQSGFRGCDTVCCIGGTAELIGGLEIYSIGTLASDLEAEGKNGLHNLFYPPHKEIDEEDWDKIKPKHAVRAISNYLTYGDPRWTEVMGPVLGRA